jgi:hypothetical protein
MKQFTHAWLAFMAIKRLDDKKSELPVDEQKYAVNLIEWFQKNRDCVIDGAWYPDEVIKDNANSHVLKISPSGVPLDAEFKEFKKLPDEYSSYKKYGKDSPMRKQAFTVDKSDNLTDRCESLAESVIDHLKIQEHEDKGSPVSPTSNQVAHLLFMLSHYIADAHVPLHCDNRQFSKGKNMHDKLEKDWEEEILKFYKVDDSDINNKRFYYENEYPSRKFGPQADYPTSYLKKVEDDLLNRELGKIDTLFGPGNKNVWDFMSAVCQNSYLLSYHFFIPAEIPIPTEAVYQDWKAANKAKSDDLNAVVIADSIDTIARIWLRVWRRYVNWKEKRDKEKNKEQPED